MQIGSNNPVQIRPTVTRTDHQTTANKPINTHDQVVANKEGVVNQADLQGALEKGLDTKEKVYIQSETGGDQFFEIDLSRPENQEMVAKMLDDLKNGSPVDLNDQMMILLSDGTETLKDAKNDRRDFKEMGINLRKDGLNQDQAEQIIDKLLSEGATPDEMNDVEAYINKKIAKHGQKLDIQVDEKTGCLTYTLETEGNTEKTRGRLRFEGKFDIDWQGPKLKKVQDGHLKIKGPKLEKVEDGEFKFKLNIETGHKDHDISIIKSSAEREEEVDVESFLSHFNDCGTEVKDTKGLNKDLKKLGVKINNGLSQDEYDKIKSHLTQKLGMGEEQANELMNGIIETYGKKDLGISTDCTTGELTFSDDDKVKDDKKGLHLKFKTPTLSMDPDIKLKPGKYKLTGPEVDFQRPKYEFQGPKIDGEIPKLKWEKGSETTTPGEIVGGGDCPTDLKLDNPTIEPTSVDPEYGPVITPGPKDLKGRYEHDKTSVMKGNTTDAPAAQVAKYFDGLPESVNLVINANSNPLGGGKYNMGLTDDRYAFFTKLIADNPNIFKGDSEGDLAAREYLKTEFGLEINGMEANGNLKASDYEVTAVDGSNVSPAFVEAANELFTLEVADGTNILQMNEDIVREDGSINPKAAVKVDAMLENLTDADGNPVTLTDDERTQLFEYAQSYLDFRGFQVDVDVKIESQAQYEELKAWVDGKTLTADTSPEVVEAHKAIQSYVEAWEQGSTEQVAPVFENFGDNIAKYEAFSAQFEKDSVPSDIAGNFIDAFNADIDNIRNYPEETIFLPQEAADLLGLEAGVALDKNAVISAMENRMETALGG